MKSGPVPEFHPFPGPKPPMPPPPRRPPAWTALTRTQRAAVIAVWSLIALAVLGALVPTRDRAAPETAAPGWPTPRPTTTTTTTTVRPTTTTTTTATTTTTTATTTTVPIAPGLPAGSDRVVQSITDGDTLRVDGGERVRLIGVDAPEASGDCYSTEATAYLRSLVPPGTPVRLVGDVEPLDRYGRTLAYLYRGSDGLHVNLALAADGYAQQVTIPPNVAHADEFGAAVAAARQAGKGLWSACPVPTATTAPPTTSAPTTATPRASCDPHYPTICVPPPPPDLDCGDITYRRFLVIEPDPHNFDAGPEDESPDDNIGCERD